MAARKPLSPGAAVAAALLLLAGCGPPPPIYAPYYFGPPPKYYYVRHGDTLYSIGQRFGVEHERIMRWNGIEDPDQLQIGQRLKLRPPEGEGSGTRQARADGSEGTPSASPSEERPEPTAEPPEDAPAGWRWPLQGEIIQEFGGTGVSRSNGIDIAAPGGTEVRAAAGGKVVYAGNGLRGYGNMVIIRHGGGYLTTYAFNRENLVREDDQVTAGDVIARVGRTGGAEQTSLHFEVRRQTEPIDPLRVLPSP